MILIPVPLRLIVFIIVLFVLATIPSALVSEFIPGGINSTLGGIMFIIGMIIEVFLILSLFAFFSKRKDKNEYK